MENFVTKGREKLAEEIGYSGIWLFEFEQLTGISLRYSEDNTFHFNERAFEIRIPEERLKSPDFEFGLAHELTEMLLRKLVIPIVGLNGNSFEIRFRLHEATVLSIGKYPLIAEAYEGLEEDFEYNLKKHHARLTDKEFSLELLKGFKLK